MTTGLERRDKFAPSQTPYAIFAGSFRKDGYGGSVDVIWAGRKNGTTTASAGTLYASSGYVGVTIDTVEDLIEKIDMRYGGNSFGKWDGESLITPATINESQRGRLIAVLDSALQAFPAVPEGYDGWYYNRRRK